MISAPHPLRPNLYSGKPFAIRLISTLFATFLLSNCGWHLRGYSGTTPTIESIYISSQNNKSEVLRELKRALRTMDVAIKDKANEAEYGLILSDERSKRRTATVSGSARISEVELTESIDFTVLASNGDKVLPLTTATTERIFEYNEDNILATVDEGRLIRSEMLRDLARQILNQLQRVGQANADATPP